jgi:thioredoxin-like negative regulator of GroEL
MSELAVRMDLARVDVRRPADVLPLFVLGPEQVRRFVDGAPRNTDDNARVEFSAPKALYQNTLDRNLELLHGFSGDPLDHVRPRPENPEKRDDLLLDLARAYVSRGRLRDARDVLAGLLDGSRADDARALAERADIPI